MAVTLQDITSLAKRRGFVYPGSEIYGGLANTYDYGPLGVELLRNLKNLWWQDFVQVRDDIVGIDTGVLMHPKVWQASGHTESFADALVDCKNCKTRTRADHLIENHLEKNNKTAKVEGKNPQELSKLIKDNKIPCPTCGKHDWTDVRPFNLLFETNIGIVPENQSRVYLRGETAQGMFVNFKQVMDSTRLTLPFGLAQIGKSFRNEITKGNHIFRTLEFEQMEIEYFFDPKKSDWKKLFKQWKKSIFDWVTGLGVDPKNLRWREHTEDERSHYSQRTIDLDYKFPFGWKELWGLAYRTDYDLKQHAKTAGVDLSYTDPKTGKKITPHVIEPAGGINRLLLMLLAEGYCKEEKRVVLKLPHKLAPHKVAVFPLLANKKDLVDKARTLHAMLTKSFVSAWDARGNIGKRYLYQDEAGTPFCITVDFDSLEDDTVTVRDRDTTKQERIKISKLVEYLTGKLN